MNKTDRPKRLVILGKPYTIEYVDKPSEVDIYKRESLWGQIDFWTRTIRVYDNGNTDEVVWHTILHEVFHGIASGLNLTELNKNSNHDELDVLALALVDVMTRNGWLE